MTKVICETCTVEIIEFTIEGTEPQIYCSLECEQVMHEHTQSQMEECE